MENDDNTPQARKEARNEAPQNLDGTTSQERSQE